MVFKDRDFEAFDPPDSSFFTILHFFQNFGDQIYFLAFFLSSSAFFCHHFLNGIEIKENTNILNNISII